MTVRYQGPKFTAKWMQDCGIEMFNRIELLSIHDRSDFSPKHLAKMKNVRRIEIWGDIADCRQWLENTVPQSRRAALIPIKGGLAAVLGK
jgi:hypothetical protein